MLNPNATPRPAENQILALLPLEEYERLRPQLSLVELPQGHILYEAGAAFDHVYFLDRGMMSVVSIMEDGSSIEVGTIGNEGMGGLSVVHPQADVEIAGETASLQLGYSADVVSGATASVFSVDAVTSATKFDDVRHEAAADDHVLSNREGSAGGRGTSGGGCGCN